MPRFFANWGADQRILHRAGRFEKWLPAMESVHLLSGRPQFHHLITDVDDIGETDLIQSFGESHHIDCHNCPLSVTFWWLRCRLPSSPLNLDEDLPSVQEQHGQKAHEN